MTTVDDIKSELDDLDDNDLKELASYIDSLLLAHETDRQLMPDSDVE